MKRLFVYLTTLICTVANATPAELKEFQGLSESEQTVACHLRFLGNVDHLLNLVDATTDPEVKRDMTKRAFPVAGLSILAGLLAGGDIENPSDREKKFGAFDPGNYDVGGQCFTLFWPMYLQRSKDPQFQSEIALLIHRKQHERYLAAGGVPKYADKPILAGGVKGVPLGATAADAKRKFQIEYPGAKIECLPIKGISQSFDCHISENNKAPMYANIPTSSLFYYIKDGRVSGFVAIYSAEQAAAAFKKLEENLRALVSKKPQLDYKAGAPPNTIAWKSGQEVLQLQIVAGDGTYFSYGLQGFFTQIAETVSPEIQSDNDM